MPKTMRFNWVQDGTNNDRPRWKLTFGDYTGEVLYGYANDGWSAKGNRISGALRLATDDEAKAEVESRIRMDIESRLKAANTALALYGEYAE